MANPHKQPQQDQPHQQDGPPSRQQERPPAPLEWIAAAIGLLLVLASMGVLGWHAVRSESGEPALRIEVGQAREQSGAWLVPLRVRNTGHRAAADLHLSGTLRQAGELVERNEARIDHLPAGAVREAGLFLSRDPRGHQLEVRAEGYQRP